MKKTKLILSSFALFVTLTLISCESNQNINPVSSDAYETEETKIEIKQKKESSKKKEDNTKKQKESLIDYNKNVIKDLFTFGNKDKFIKPDVTSVFTNTITGSIKQQESTIHIRIKDGLAGFGSTYMSAYYIILMNPESRKKLESAYNNYLYDFSNKKLNRKGSKIYKKYGSMNITLNWGTLKSTTPNNGTGEALLGYEFKKNSPYFTITCYPLENKYYDIVGDTTSKESMMLKYYFTKAQVKELLSMITDEKINSALYDITFTNESDYEEYNELISEDDNENDITEENDDKTNIE